MRKMFVLLMSTFMIVNTFTACGSDEKSISVTAKNTEESSSITQTANETEITPAEVTYVLGSTVSSNSASQITDIADEYEIPSAIITSAATEVIFSSIPTAAELLQETENIVSAKNEQQERSPVVMVSIYESWAYGFEQNISVLDSDGYYSKLCF